MKYSFVASGNLPGGRLVIYKDPVAHMNYSLGGDFSCGIQSSDSSDYDYFVMLDSFGEQVMEAEGRWGGARSKPILDSIIDYYEQEDGARVFCVFESTAHSLDVLRSLYSDGRWIYFARDDSRRSRPVQDRLGHSPGHMDVTITHTRNALAPRDIDGKLLPSKLVIHSSRILEQLEQFSFLLTSSRKDPAEARDEDYTWGANRGWHDDGVRAFCLAYCGLLWLPKYDPPPKPINPHSFAAVLRHDEVLRPHAEICKSRLLAASKPQKRR